MTFVLADQIALDPTSGQLMVQSQGQRLFFGPGMPTFQTKTEGSGVYQPTSAAVTWIRVWMTGGGGGGSGAGSTAGGASSFAGWTANGGQPGTAPIGVNGQGGGGGGNGGTNGAGIVIVRQSGNSGQIALTNAAPSLVALWGPGAYGFPGNRGAGGAGGAAGVANQGSGAGGGQGEIVEFVMTAAQASGTAWTVGAGGAGGAANPPNLSAGTAGTAGIIIVEENYTALQPAAVMAANAAAQIAALGAA